MNVKKVIVAGVIALVFQFQSFHLPAQPVFDWAQKTGDPGQEDAYSIALDEQGNVYTTGYFGGTVDFDPSESGVYNLSAGGFSAFITKMDSTGNFLWARQLFGTGTYSGSRGTCITLNKSNIYITGNFSYSVDFDPSQLGIYELTASGNLDAFVCKLDTAGNFIWAGAMGGAAADEGLSITTDGLGNVYTAGYFNDTADFNPSATATFNLAPYGILDIFISKLNASGDFIWAKHFTGGMDGDKALSIVSDTEGNSYTTGYFENTVDVDPGSGTYNLIAAGPFDAFVNKLNPEGDFVWAARIGGTADDKGYAIALGNEAIYVTGYFGGTSDFNPSATDTFHLTSLGTRDMFVCKLHTSGDFLWAKNIGGKGGVYPQSIALDANENVYTTGSATGTIDFNPGSGTYNLSAAGSFDIYVSKLSPSGNFVYAVLIGGTKDDWGHSVAADAFQNIYMTGHFSDTADFDPGADTHYLRSGGNYDLFNSKLDKPVCQPPSLEIEPASPVTIVNGATTVLNAVGNDIDTYQWTPSTGLSCTDCANPVSASTHTTAYTLTVTDFNDCISSYTVTVFVVKSGEVTVPSVFTPNGDGENDTFQLLDSNENFNIVIYNRWGIPVYEFDQSTDGWNGKNKTGQDAPAGTYYYVLNTRSFPDLIDSKQGNILLVR